MTIKQQLIPLRIGKGLLSLVALFVMLLAPQRAWAEDYVLSIAGHQYTADQLKVAQTVTGDGISGTVTLTPGSEQDDPVKLTFNNAVLSGNIVSSINLTVDFVGSSVINLPNNVNVAFVGNNSPVLSFTNSGKYEKPLSVTGVLELTTIISGWDNSKSVDLDLGYSAPLSLESEWWIHTITSYELILEWNKSYELWIDGAQVKSFCKDNVKDDPETPTVVFNADKNELTLTNASIGINGTNAIVSGLESGLTIKLVGASSISIPQTASSAIKSTVNNAPLVFTTEEQDAELTIAPSNGTIFEGFSVSYQNGLVYKAGRIYKFQVPQFYSDVIEGVTYFGFEEDDVYYSIDYVSEDIDDVPETKFEENVSILGPCTVTAYSKVETVQSETVTAKYFGFADIKTVYSANNVLDTPALLPTLPSIEGLTIEYSQGGSVANFDQDNGKININGIGSTVLTANFTYSGNGGFTILNKNVGSDEDIYQASLNITILPPAPTISSTAVFEGDAITITAADGLTNPQIYYSWESNDNTGTLYNAQTLPTAQSGTLYAWVTMTIEVGDNKYETYTSSKAEQIFSVKKNIANLTVNPNSILDSESVVYTGTTITPTFTLLTNPEDESTAISSSNYDVRIEKYVDETTGYSVVTSVLDAGTYKVYAVGKGDTYGGEKLIYEALVVNKANIQGLPTVAANDLVYDGTEQVLLPITVPDGVTVEYFFASITEEDYKGSYDLNCAGEVSYSTTIPKATNAGYFAIIYKVDGGNNYNNVRPSGTIKVAIYPAEITELTIATNSLTYTGEAQTVTITSVKAGELVLTTSDYDVSYEVVEEQGASPVDAPVETGTYNAVVTGKGNFTGTQSAKFTVLKDPKFCFYVDGTGTISNGETKEYEYGLEQPLPVLKRQDNGSLIDPTGFTITYTSSDPNVATIDNTGKITIVGVGQTEIRASVEATGEYAADEAWLTMMVVPAFPQVSIDQVSIEEGAYFTGQKLKITTDAQGGDLYYSYGYEKDEKKRIPYDGEEISLPKGEYLFCAYVRCGTDDNPIWSYPFATELYVYDEPTISKDAGEYEGDIEVEITNLPQPQSNNISVKVYYYLGDDDDNEENDILYKAGDKITVRESTKLNVYLYLVVEGDSSKSYKTKVIERQYTIKDIPLDVTAADFHNHWMTYYHNENGNVGLPENQNIGAYVATSISGNEIVVTQIKSIPRGEPVLLNDATTTTTTNVFGQDVQGNLLVHATDDVDVAEEAGKGDFYGLYNGTFMRVTGTIPARKNYLMVPNAVVPSGNAPQLTIVIDGEATGVNDVRSKIEDVRGDIYDLQGRKVQKPSKKGLYINKGHKVVVK